MSGDAVFRLWFYSGCHSSGGDFLQAISWPRFPDGWLPIQVADALEFVANSLISFPDLTLAYGQVAARLVNELPLFHGGNRKTSPRRSHFPQI